MDPSNRNPNDSNFPLTELPALHSGINDSREEPSIEDNFVSQSDAPRRNIAIDESLHAKKRGSSLQRDNRVSVPQSYAPSINNQNPVQEVNHEEIVVASKSAVIIENKPYMSQNMIWMSSILNKYREEKEPRIQTEIITEFQKLVSGLLDKDEVLMALYLCVSRFMTQNIFTQLLVKNGSFKDLQTSWYLLFTEQNVFNKLSHIQSSVQRSQFNQIVLRQALDRDYQFIIEDLLDGRCFVTNTMIEILWIEGQKRQLATLIAVPKSSKATRPRFLHLNRKNKRSEIRNVLGFGNGVHINQNDGYIDANMSYPEISTQEVIQIGLELNTKSQDLIEFLTILRNEIRSNDIPDASQQLNYKELFKLFVKNRKMKLLRFLFSHKIDFEFNTQIFILALEEDAFDIATLLHQEFRFLMRQNLSEENKVIVSLIVSSMNKTTNLGAGMIEQKTYLVREYLDFFQLRNARQLLDFIDKKINIPNKLNILVSNLNVVLTGCLLFELLELVGSKFDQLKVRCDNIKVRIEQHVGKYMMRVTRQDEMRYLLLEKDLEERDSLDLITKYEIYSFLKSQFAENVVKEIWRSPYATSDSIQAASTNYFLLFNYYHCEQDIEKQMRFFKGKKEKKIENNSLQFTVWRFSGKSRAMVDAVTTLIITILTHHLLRQVLQLNFGIVEQVRSIEKIEAEWQALLGDPRKAKYDELKLKQGEVQEDFLKFFNINMNIAWLSFMSLFFGIQYIADITYSAATNKNYNPGKFRTFLDMFIFIVFFINIIVTFATNLRSTISEGLDVVSWDEKAYKYCRNYVNNTIDETNLLILGVIALWVRVISFAKYNDYLGRYIGIVQRLISEIVLFFVIYLINLLFFACVADSAFRDLNNYNTIPLAFKTLFYASFGEFDFDEISNSDIGPNFGLSYLIIFLIINLGLFMSLFVSIITVLYNIFHKSDRIYQMIETLKIRSHTQADKNYSLLISVPAPFNFFLIFAAPVLMTSSNPERMNQKLLLIFYSPILVVTTVLFLAFEILMWPFCYIKMVFHKLTMTWVYSRTYRTSRADKFMNFVFYFFFGPVFIIANTFIDLLFFVQHMIRFDLQKIKHKTRFNKITKSNLQLIHQQLEPNQEKIMHFKDLSTSVRSKMNIVTLIQQALFPNINTDLFVKKKYNLQGTENHTNQLHKEAGMEDAMYEERKKMMAKIREFQVFKQILDKNSQMLGLSLESLKNNEIAREIHYELQSRSFKIVDCKLFNIFMEDLNRQRMMAKVKEDEYIFIKMVHKPSAKAHRSANRLPKESYKENSIENLKIGDAVAFGQNAENTEIGVDLRFVNSSEASRLIEKRERNIFKKLYYLNSSRILQIVGYVPTQADERKFLFSNYKQFITEKKYIEATADGTPQVNYMKLPTGKADVSPNLYGGSSQKFMNDIQNQVFELSGGSVPRLQNTVALFKNELQTMIERLRPVLEKMPSESIGQDRYSEFIGKLHPSKYKMDQNYF